MSKRFLLDTSAAIARLNGDKSIEPILADADEIFISSVTIGVQQSRCNII